MREGIESAEVKTPEQKDRMVAALGQLLTIAPLEPLRPVQTEPLMPFVSGESGSGWFDIPPDEKKRFAGGIWPNYPSGHYPEDFPVSVWSEKRDKTYVVQLGEGIRKVHRFWKTYPVEQWQAFQGQARQVADAYLAVIKVASHPESTTTESGFTERVSDFIRLSDALAAYSSEQSAGFSLKAFRSGCKADYEQLRASASENTDPMIRGLNRTLENNSGFCRQIHVEIGKHRDETLAHILNKDGTVTEALTTVTDLMRLAEAYGPLFSPEDKKKLAEAQDKAVETIRAWNALWQKEREELDRKLAESLETVTAPGWQQEQLKAAMGQYLDHVMWLADKNAVNAALEALLTDHEHPPKSLRKNADPPVTARAEWLVARFEMVRRLQHDLKSRHPKHPGVKTFARKADKSVADTYARCMKFWQRSLDKYNPVPAFLKHSQWETFRPPYSMYRAPSSILRNSPLKDFWCIWNGLT